MKRYKKVILLLVIVILSIILTACTGGHDNKEIREMMKKHLYAKYGEEFVVDRIGIRKFGDTEFYQGRIYPKSIIGTPKEGDEYYYAEVNIDKLGFGRLRDPGDTYGRVIVRERAEDYLMPKIKKIFGDRVKIKPKISYYTRNKYGAMVGYLTSNFKGALEKSINDPENNRLELELYLYIFNRIEDKKEKEKRRKQIFNFVQYLKDEGLFKYLELGVIFIDERVLAPSFREYSSEVYFSDKVEKEVDGETVYLPPMELRKEMSKVLQKEVDKMSKEELLANMRKIRKSELTYDEMREYNGQYNCWIYSLKMLKLHYNVTEEDKKRKYNSLNDIKLEKYSKYMFLN